MTLDPKRPGVQPQIGKGRVPYREIYVFMIGGGSYAEYQTMQEYIKNHPDRQITYGCTELLNGESFLRQIGSL